MFGCSNWSDSYDVLMTNPLEILAQIYMAIYLRDNLVGKIILCLLFFFYFQLDRIYLSRLFLANGAMQKNIWPPLNLMPRYFLY